MKYITVVDGQEFVIEIINKNQIVINGQPLQIDFESIHGQPVYSLIVDGKSYEAYVYPDEDNWQVLVRGNQYGISVVDEREKRLRAAAGGGQVAHGEIQLKAPMPGLIVDVLAEEGQAVERGDVLIILESMKMQNELRAARDGVVRRVRVKKGDSVEQKQTLLSVE